MEIPLFFFFLRKKKGMYILKQSTSYLGLAELPAFETLNYEMASIAGQELSGRFVIVKQ